MEAAAAEADVEGYVEDWGGASVEGDEEDDARRDSTSANEGYAAEAWNSGQRRASQNTPLHAPETVSS